MTGCKTSQPVLKPVDWFWNGKRMRQKSLNGYGHEKLLTLMRWCSWKFLDSFGSLIPVTLWMQVMQSHDNSTWMEERFEEYIKKKFSTDQKRSTSSVIYAAFGEKLKTVWKTLKCFLRSFVTMWRRNCVYLKYTIHRAEWCFGSTKIWIRQRGLQVYNIIMVHVGYLLLFG